jgi:hypothetical protein
MGVAKNSRDAENFNFPSYFLLASAAKVALTLCQLIRDAD